MKRLLIYFFTFININFTFSQDTLSFMYYNILSYSPSNISNTKNLKGIIKSINPDIFAVNEISNEASAKHILMYVLNTGLKNHYKKAEFIDGPDTDNLLFYNSDKVSLYSQDTIHTDLRIINEYLCYYNNSVNKNDTIFFYVYVAHLKASSGSTNKEKRYNEVLSFKNHLNKKVERKNIFFGGDFNFYGSDEPALIELLKDGNYKMNDPIDSIGYWHDNSLYANIHTQSTRKRNFGGGSSGGLDDRFDFILVSNDIMYGTNKLKYISGTYQAFGNNGQHFNDSLSSSDKSIPDSIICYLYNMSDHLPVIMKTYINIEASVSNISDINYNFQIYPNPTEGIFLFLLPIEKTNAILDIYEQSGRLTVSYDIKTTCDKQQIISMNNDLKNGLYFAKLTTNKKVYFCKFALIR